MKVEREVWHIEFLYNWKTKDQQQKTTLDLLRWEITSQTAINWQASLEASLKARNVNQNSHFGN